MWSVLSSFTKFLWVINVCDLKKIFYQKMLLSSFLCTPLAFVNLFEASFKLIQDCVPPPPRSLLSNFSHRRNELINFVISYIFILSSWDRLPSLFRALIFTPRVCSSLRVISSCEPSWWDHVRAGMLYTQSQSCYHSEKLFSSQVLCIQKFSRGTILVFN